jgi:hypothetical protein
MTWEGLGDIINNFRKKTLGLPKLSTTVAPTVLKTLEVPHTYIWSEALIPKPKDWGNHIGKTVEANINSKFAYTKMKF